MLMVKSKSTFITIDDDSRFKWKKSIFSEMVFSTNHRWLYLRITFSTLISSSLVMIMAGFSRPCPVMIISLISFPYPFKSSVRSWTLSILVLFPAHATRTVVQLSLGICAISQITEQNKLFSHFKSSSSNTKSFQNFCQRLKFNYFWNRFRIVFFWNFLSK